MQFARGGGQMLHPRASLLLPQAAAGEVLAELDKLPPLDVAALLAAADAEGGDGEGMM
jgi:hypothetical protein